MFSRRLLAVALVGLSMVVLAACGGSPDPTATPRPADPQATPTPAPTGFEAEWQQLIAAAQAEGEVQTFICCGPGVPVNQFIPDFEREFGIRWINSTGSSSQNFEKVRAEREAGRYTLDLWTGGLNTSNRQLLPAGFLEPLKPHLIHPEVTDESLWYMGEHFWADHDFGNQHVFVYAGNASLAEIAYNTQNVDPNSIQSYWDLLDDRFRGRIVMRDPRAAGTSQSTAFYYAQAGLGPDFLERLLTEMDVVILDDARQAADQLAAGVYDICMFACTTEVREARLAGLPVAEDLPNVLQEGSRISSGGNTLMMMKDAPNPNAAKLWANWWLSREGQIVFQKTDGANSLRMDIPKDDVEPHNLIDPNRDYLYSERDPDFQQVLDASLEFVRGVLAGR